MVTLPFIFVCKTSHDLALVIDILPSASNYRLHTPFVCVLSRYRSETVFFTGKRAGHYTNNTIYQHSRMDSNHKPRLRITDLEPAGHANEREYKNKKPDIFCVGFVIFKNF